MTEMDEQELISKAVKLEQNLDIKDRRYHLKHYKNCFVGNAAIPIIINLKFANNIDEAIVFGNKLIEAKIIKHVQNQHTFKNEKLFYSFINGYNRPKININGAMDLLIASKQISEQNDDDDNVQINDIKEAEQEQINDINIEQQDDLKKDDNDNDKDNDIDIDIDIDTKKQEEKVKVSKLNGSEHDALALFDLILRGNLFYYEWNKHLFDIKTQKTLINYIENYLNDVHDLNDFNLNYFQHLFNDKIKGFLMNPNGIFINIEQISSLNTELMAYFFDVNHKDFKGKIFLKGCFIECGDNVQFIEIPEFIELNSTQIELIKDDKYFGDIMFKKFQVTNKKNQGFKFYLKIQRKHIDNDNDNDNDKEKESRFHIFLYLKSKPENIKTVNLIWDCVCPQLQFENIEKRCQLQRNKCDEIDAFLSSSLHIIQSELTFIVNIRIIS